jgi:hypothetical protein
MKIIEFLGGKKSYIVSVLVALYTLLNVFGVLNTTPEQDIAVYGLLSALFGMAIRSAIK